MFLYIQVIKFKFRYKVQFLMASQSPTTNLSVQMAGASIFNPDSSQWVARTTYEYLDSLQDGASVPAKLSVFIVLKRHIVVKISAFLLLIFNCEVFFLS